jgi:streptogrisin C
VRIARLLVGYTVVFGLLLGQTAEAGVADSRVARTSDFTHLTLADVTSTEPPDPPAGGAIDHSPAAYLIREYGMTAPEAADWVQHSWDSEAVVALLRSQGEQHFGTYQLDYAARRIDLAAVDPPVDYLAEVAAQWPQLAAQVRVREVRYSLGQLFEAEAVLRDLVSTLPGPDRSLSTHIDDDTNRVVVTHPSLSRSTVDLLRRLLGDRVAFKRGAPPRGVGQACDFPTRCQRPARGSIRYGPSPTSSSSYDCTSGFVSRNAPGSWYIMTAGHCHDGAGTRERHQNTYSANDPDAPTRRLLFGVPNTGWRISGRVDGARGFINSTSLTFWNPSRWVYHSRSEQAIQIRNKIGSLAAIPVGALVCRGGGRSLTDCGEITQRSQRVTIDYDPPTGERIMYLTRTNYCSRPGDSGGPVYSRNTSEGVLLSTAYGIHSAAVDRDSCGANDVAWFSPTYSIESSLDIQIWCGGSQGGDPGGPQGCRVY